MRSACSPPIASAETGDAKIDGFAEMPIDKAPGMTLVAIPFVIATAATGIDSSEVQRVFLGAGIEKFLTSRMRLTSSSPSRSSPRSRPWRCLISRPA